MDDPLKLKFSRPDSHAIEDLTLIVKHEKPTLVVVDTVTRMPKAVFQLNDYMRNSEWLDPYMYLAHEEDVTILVNYHSSRNGRGLEGLEAISAPLGSVGIIATPDQIIALKVESDGTRSITSVGRYEHLPQTLLGFDKDTHRLSVLGEKSTINDQKLQESILAVLTLSDELDPIKKLTTKELMKEVLGNADEKSRALKKLVAENMISQTGEGKKGSPYLYQLEKNRFSIPALVSESRIDFSNPKEDLPTRKEMEFEESKIYESDIP